jgi:Domain of unknown function (DUF222)
LEALSEVIAALAGYVRTLEPDRSSGDDASRLVDLFNQGSKLCAAGRALAAKRAAAANAWKAEGYRSAEEWLAAKTKTSRSAAAESLKTAAQIEKLPATRDAFVGGRVSAEQAAAIASGATADPTAEDFLLREAERASLGGLQKTSRALVAAAQRSQAADRERIHRSRYFRSWTSADGAFEGRFRLTPDAGATLLAALDAERREVFAQARAEGRHETSEAYNADALVNLARTTLEAQQAADDNTDDPDADTAAHVEDQPEGGAGEEAGAAQGQAGEEADTAQGQAGEEANSADGQADGREATVADEDAGVEDVGVEDVGVDDGAAEDEAAEDEAVADRTLANSIDIDPTVDTTRPDHPDTGGEPPRRPRTGDPNPRSGPPAVADKPASAPAPSSTPASAPAAAGSDRPKRRRRGRTPPNVVHIRVDLEALLRGHTNP